MRLTNAISALAGALETGQPAEPGFDCRTCRCCRCARRADLARLSPTDRRRLRVPCSRQCRHCGRRSARYARPCGHASGEACKAGEQPRPDEFGSRWPARRAAGGTDATAIESTPDATVPLATSQQAQEPLQGLRFSRRSCPRSATRSVDSHRSRRRNSQRSADTLDCRPGRSQTPGWACRCG